MGLDGLISLQLFFDFGKIAEALSAATLLQIMFNIWIGQLFDETVSNSSILMKVHSGGLDSALC